MCTRCRNEKGMEEFVYGLKSCDACVDQKRDYRKRTVEKNKEYNKSYREANKEKVQCPLCGVEITKYKMKQHEATQGHKEKLLENN